MKKKIEIKSPVLLIAFNRPDITQVVLNSIKEVEPKKLYIAVDGPRINKINEKNLCDQVINIINRIDWNCDVKYLIRTENQGCKIAVSSAITWALETEERIIIIEDDIVALPSFYYFVDEMLEKYANDEKIAMVSGNNYTPSSESLNDYLFSKYGHIWGWGTWKRVWEKFDLNIPDLEESIESNLVGFDFVNKAEKIYFKKYFSKILNDIKLKIDNYWGPQFAYYRFKNKLLSIVPSKNLASNIGTISARTDVVLDKNINFYPADPNYKINNYNNSVKLDRNYDRIHFAKHIHPRISLFKKIRNKIKRLLNKSK